MKSIRRARRDLKQGESVVGTTDRTSAEAPKWMSTTQAAAFLHRTPAQVRRYIDTGQLPARRVKRHWRIMRAAVIRFAVDRVNVDEVLRD